MSRSDRVVFRLPAVSLVIPLLLFVCATPLASAAPHWLLSLYALPVIALVYIVITRTVADAEVIRTTGLLRGHRVAWSNLDGFEFRGSRWATAVAHDGRRFRLPMVRPRDLPRLAQVSGGRLLLGPDAPKPEAAEPVEPGEPGPLADPGDAGDSRGPGEPAVSGKPDVSGESDVSGEPDVSGESDVSGKPDGAAMAPRKTGVAEIATGDAPPVAVAVPRSNP